MKFSFFVQLQKSDSSILAQFFFADEELNEVAAELDSFDGRKDPERCTVLVNKLRACQDKVLVVVQKIIDEAIGNQKANRDFRVKFPDDVLQENLAGQLWFGAEVLWFTYFWEGEGSRVCLLEFFCKLKKKQNSVHNI